MRAKAWKGATFGIRVGKANADKFFDRDSPFAEIEIDGNFSSFRLSETFWGACPEIRGVPIGRWLRKRGLDTWQDRRPLAVELTPLGKNRFKLSECSLASDTAAQDETQGSTE